MYSRSLLLLIVLTLAVQFSLDGDVKGHPGQAPARRTLTIPPEIVSQVPVEEQRQVQMLMGLDAFARRTIVDRWFTERRIALAPAIAYVLVHEPWRQFRIEMIEDLIPGWPALGRRDEVRVALERVVLDDADVTVALSALELLRIVRTQDSRALLRRRLDAAVAAKREEEAAQLAAEDDRWVGFETGAPLPDFLREPVPVFSVTAQPRIRVAVIGDFGNGSRQQRQVAKALLQLHRQEPFDFGVTLGDNFYTKGIFDPSDVRWKTWWEDLYGPLEIPFFASLGNHDWGHPDSPAVEMLYSWKSSTWRMPSLYYSFVAGPVQFFATNTEHLSRGQMAWLDRGLSRSTAWWKIVYGHHPPAYPNRTPALMERIDRVLLPVLDGADAFLAGHTHELAHLVSGPLNIFVSAAAGEVNERRPATPTTLFSAHRPGFVVLEATYNTLTVRFIDIELTELYHYTLRK